MNEVIVIYGPTAVGKSAIAVELAKMINGEIISADSMQVYKKLNVGTAKVTKEEMQGVPHHLIDILSAGDDYSVSDFCSRANRLIPEILSRNKVPIIVGGTGLYIKALIDGYNFGGVSKSTKFRDSLNTLSNEEIYIKIKEIEPEIIVDHANRQRLIRTYERLFFNGEIENLKSVYNFKLFIISDDRQKIYDRINKRVEKMIDAGILEELKYLLDLNLPEDNLCMKAIGYKEFFSYVKGVATLDECKDLLKQKTRNYAKRQFTFINQFNKKTLINFCGIKETASKINKLIGE